MSDSPTPPPPVRRGLARLIEAGRGVAQLWSALERADDAAEAAQLTKGEPNTACAAVELLHCRDAAPAGWHCTRPDAPHAQCTLERDR